MTPGDFTNERARRFGVLAALRAVDPTLKSIPAAVVRELGVYGRYRGTYTELVNSDDEQSVRVALSVLHTGRHYADDLSASSLIYHYPATEVPGYDRSDIDAGKTALLLKLPIFVVLYPTVGDSAREIRVGYVVDADDQNQQFLIQFGEEPVSVGPLPDDTAFAAIVEERRKKRRTTNVRNNDQAKFAFDVAKRYGTKCAVCRIRVAALIDAAHVVPVSVLGSDDARNGIPLCSNHHRAFDSHLFSFGGHDCEIAPGPDETLQDLGITETRATTASGALPHPEAIELCNELRKKKS